MPFVRQKIAEFVLHILGTEDDPVRKQALNDTLAERFAPLERIALKNATAFDAHISSIQQPLKQIRAHIELLQQRSSSARSRDNHSQE